MNAKIIAILVGIVIFIVAGMVLTMKKATKPRDFDPSQPPKTAPKK